MKIAIIGGGASGLFCGMLCAKANLHVDIYEQNNKCGKKILVSGNGKCNITNTNLSCEFYTGNDTSFCKYALNEFGFERFKNVMKDIGIILVQKDSTKVYPLSNEAKTIQSLLLQKAISYGANIHTNTKIKSAKELFKTHDAVVVATGSQAHPQLGGCDDGYNFAKEFGHTIKPTYPALVGLELKGDIHKSLSGVKLHAKVSLHVDKEIFTCKGDILFTNYGISGLAILDISHIASKALLKNKTQKLTLNLMPSFEFLELSNLILKISKNAQTPLNTIHAILPLKIAKYLTKEMQNINQKTAKTIANNIQNMTFVIKDTHGFKHAEASGGGINTSEIDKKTMMSKKQKNLYFCGEVLDVLGKRGGYNLAWAWASGYLVAKNLST